METILKLFQSQIGAFCLSKKNLNFHPSAEIWSFKLGLTFFPAERDKVAKGLAAVIKFIK